MDYWDNQFINLLKESGVQVKLYKRYKDDIKDSRIQNMYLVLDLFTRKQKLFKKCIKTLQALQHYNTFNKQKIKQREVTILFSIAHT